MISNKEALQCMKENVSFNTGTIAYVADPSGKQGLMSKVVGNKVYVASEDGRWIEC